MKIIDDIDSLRIHIKDADQAEIIFYEKMKLVARQLPISLFGLILSGFLLFIMMLSTLTLHPYQKTLNLSWLMYHTFIIGLTWYWWRVIFKNPAQLRIDFIKKIFLTFFIFLTLANSLIVLGFVFFWYQTHDVTMTKSLQYIWCVTSIFQVISMLICWDSWKTTTEIAHNAHSHTVSKLDFYSPLNLAQLEYSTGDKHQTQYLANYVGYRVLLIGSLTIGCLWAVLIIKIISTDTQQYTQLIVLIGLYFGLLAGTISSIGLFWRVYIMLVLPSLLGWILTIFFVNDPKLIILSLAIVVLLSLNVFLARHNWLNSIATVQIYLENTRLASQLHIKSKQLEHASFAKTRLLAAASHDLRQPVQALSLFIETLAHTKLTKQQQQIVDYSRTASQSSREMLNTILDYAHLESGEMVPHIVPAYLDNMIQTLVDEFGMQAVDKSLSLRYHPTTLCVMTDPAMLSLILRNFLSNALRYTAKGGVLIGVRRVASNNKDCAVDYCRISVWDTGSGLTPEEIEQIFGSFYQLPRNNHNNQGLGLGLSIAQGMAKLLDVQITVQSKFGSGSQFSVILPICSAHDDCRMISHVNSDNHLAGQTILVVDDEDSVLKSMRLLLESWGCHVATAFTLDEAVRVFKLKRPNLVITDYRLAHFETGEDVIAAIQRLQPKTVRFVVLTGDTSPELVKNATTKDITVLHKPLAPKALHNTLQKLATAIFDNP